MEDILQDLRNEILDEKIKEKESEKNEIIAKRDELKWEIAKKQVDILINEAKYVNTGEKDKSNREEYLNLMDSLKNMEKEIDAKVESLSKDIKIYESLKDKKFS